MASSERIVLLCDAKWMLHRANYAYASLRTKDGRPSGGLYGFFQDVLQLHRRYPEASMVFCWDWKGKTWRHELWAGYKGNREYKEAELKPIFCQQDAVQKALQVAGLKQAMVDGLEGDDLLGLLSTGFVSKGYRVVIVSADRDLYQCLGSGRCVQLRRVKKEWKEFDLKAVISDVGVRPNLWVNVKALMGDAGDNIPGLPGVGPKTAAKMVSDGVDPTYERWENLPPDVQRKYPELRSQWCSLHLWAVLASIPRLLSEVPSRLRKQTKEVLTEIFANPGRSSAGSVKMVKIFAEWDAVSLIAERHELLSIR